MAQAFHLGGAGTFTLQSAGGGTLTLVTVGTGAAGATVTLYDNTAASGKVIGQVSAAAAVAVQFDVPLTKGLTVVIAGGSPDITITVS